MEAEGHTFPDGIASAIITGMSELWLSDPGVLTLMILGLQIVNFVHSVFVILCFPGYSYGSEMCALVL